jgi:nucleoside 2-deoxyribosyltransferase
MPMIYLAAPLFSNAERRWNASLRDYFASRGFSVFMPWDECMPHQDDPARIYEICKRGVEICDAVLAVLDGEDVDSGVSWECGYAKGIGKKVIGVRTDFRKCERFVDGLITDVSGDDRRLFARIVQSLSDAAGGQGRSGMTEPR